MLTVREVAGHLRRSTRFVRDEIIRKNLRAIKVGDEWRVTEADLERYIDAKANVTLVRGKAS